MTAPLLLLAAYLIGAIPFGWLIGRARGVDLFQAGSGNIGATNAGRVLGRKFGILVFVLDLLKGALPVAAVSAFEVESPNAVRAGVAALAFFGHLFPIYLGFRGGKGVATGAGTVLVLAPIPAACAIGTWIVVVLASRTVSLASLAAVGVLALTRLLQPSPFSEAESPITLFLLIGAVVVAAKHRSNIGRLRAGTESRLRDFAMRETLVRGLHVLALGLWFGGAGFFNFVAAPKIFQSFDAVAKGGPSDRTAHFDITKGMNEEEKKTLGSALAGAAVGPIFPAYFALQTVGCAVSLVTAFSWRNRPGRVNRVRIWVLAAAMLVVAISIPISLHVSDLRVMRFDVDPAVAAAAKADFGPWHLVSLLLSFVTVCLAGVALAMASALPNRDRP
jgi:acyl-phosphate glycerol 3-phosphate acyltransferase